MKSIAEIAADLGIALEPSVCDELEASRARLQAALDVGASAESPVPATVAEMSVVAAPARTADRGGPYVSVFGNDASTTARGPLAGMTVAVKDLIAVAGNRLGAGSRTRDDAPPEPADAEIVRELRALGAVIVGTTALHELAFGVTGINDSVGWPRNPHDPARVPGGSSSGSAVAVAEGSAQLALGTDTGGSLRIPAAFCAVVGYKPSFGAYPVEGVLPLAPTLDHVGFVAATTEPIRRAHAALGFDVGAPRLPTRVGLLSAELDEAETDVAAAVRGVVDTLARRGVEITSVERPDPERVFAVSTTIMFSEAAAVHRATLRERAAELGADVRNRLLLGASITRPTYVAALRTRDALKRQVAELLADVDLLVGPTVGVFPPLADDARDASAGAVIVRNTRLANVVGLPAVSLPVRGTRLPVGLQLLGSDDAELLGAAAAVERL